MHPRDGLDPVVRATLSAVAGHALTVVAGGPGNFPAEPLGDRQWRSLLRAVRMERLLGLLDRAIDDGALRATETQAADAETAAAHALRNVLHLERRLLAVARHLSLADVAFAVLKGPAVARLDEADPGLRNYADIDLLVRADDLVPALSGLAALGYHRDLPERRPGFDRRFGKEISLADEHRSELDLHRTLALGCFGLRIDPSMLWESTVPFRLGPTDLAALDAEGRFVHACITAALGDEHPRLVALRDLARIATAHQLRPERLERILPFGRGAAVVAAAVSACRAELGAEVGDVAASFAAAATPSRWERIALGAYRSQGGSNTLELLSGAMGLTGADRLHYLRALVAPDPGYLSARRRAGRSREWTTGLREVVARRRHHATEEAGRA